VGCDVLVWGKHFDALTPDGVLWEVKTHAYSRYSSYIRGITISAHTLEAVAEQIIAAKCGRRFVFAVADLEHYDVLKEQVPFKYINLRHIPRCKR
jgi:hypothetical protein